MKYSKRRFPDKITRRRREPGARNTFGEWVPGGTTDVTFAASVQPIKLDYSLTEGGTSLLQRWLCIVPEPDALRGAFEDREKDSVIFAGTVYVVEESRDWSPGHTSAILYREIP